MRLHRFYLSETIGLKTEVVVHSADLSNQIRRVFRLKSGDSVILFDGSGSDYTCRIETMDSESVTFTVVESSRSRFVPERDVYLCASVVKKDTFEWIVEKATELGVTHIIPVMAVRSEKKSLNEERLCKIAVEASEQSGRSNVPFIHDIMTLSESLALIESKSISAIAFHVDGQHYDHSDSSAKKKDVAIFIGPEGGWTAEEVALFHSQKVPTLSLGNQVLRAETAVVASLSVVMM